MIPLYNKYYILIFLITIGFIFRFFNVNFDDLWIDEIVSFWVANPYLTIQESLNNHKNIEQAPVLYNFFHKLYFKIFGYHDQIARYLSVIFSTLSIPLIFYLSKLLRNDNSAILVTFFTTFNIFLIAYSQEMRVYSIVFFFNILNLYLFFKILKKFKISSNILFIFSSIISLLLHPFSFILIFSIINYLLYLNIFEKKKYFNLYVSIFIVTSFFIIYYYIYSLSSLGTPAWIIQPDLSFYLNFYSSKFFGSRLVGILHIFMFLYLIMFYFKKSLKKKYIIFLLIFVFYSYFLPMVYGYIFEPIILARYLIFVLIPIFLIISHIVFELESFKKNIFILIIIIMTIGNFVTEETFKQFYKQRSVYKPEFKKALRIINNSSNKLYDIKIKDGLLYSNSWDKAVENYLNHIINNSSLDIKRIPNLANNIVPYWIICIHDLNEGKCDTKTEIIKKHYLNRLELILTK